MKTNAERFPILVPLFRAAIIDKIKEQHSDRKDANGDVQYIPSTQALRQAAFKAMTEVVGSEADPVDAMLAVNVWSAVMLSNESAFHQGLERDIKKGLVKGIKITSGARAVAQGYNE